MDLVQPIMVVDRLTTLPDEILEIILGYISDSVDTISISRGSSVCERILLPSKSTWLFHAILPQISAYLSKQDLLHCRSVCSKWRKSVDNYLENVTNNGRQHKEFSFSPTTPTAITGFCFAMKEHIGNPFPARRVDFRNFDDRPFTGRYWVHVFQFLNQFGEHVWNCSFDFGNTRFDLFVIVLRQCLAHLKNVRRLHICWKFNQSEVSEEKMVSHLETSTFPPLPQLQHMELTGVFSRVFYQKVVIPVYSDQLKTLKVDGITN